MSAPEAALTASADKLPRFVSFVLTFSLVPSKSISVLATTCAKIGSFSFLNYL
jgi:hypothetical protein